MVHSTRIYFIVVVAVAIASFGLAQAGDWLAQHVWTEPYLVLPVEQTSLYFFPLLACGTVWIALRSGRVDRPVIVAAILLVLFSQARVLDWWSVARERSAHPDVANLELQVPERLRHMAVGAFGLVGLGVLVHGIVLSGRRVTSPEPAVEMRLNLVTLALCLFNVVGVISFFRVTRAFSGDGLIAFGAFYMLVRALSFALIWFFWRRRTQARRLVLATSTVALIYLTSTTANGLLGLAQATLGAWLLFWLNTPAVAGFFKTAQDSSRQPSLPGES